MSWQFVPLGNIGEFRNGLNYTQKNEGHGLRILNVKDFKDRFFPEYTSLDEINPMGVVKDEDLLCNGDIVFVRSNGNKDLVGRSVYIENPPENVSFSGFSIRLRFTDLDLIPKFYAYFLRSPLFRKKLSLLGSGTNISNLNQMVLKNMLVPRPSKQIQEQVVDILSNYDNLIENNRRRIQLLEQSAHLLYKEWFVHLRYPGCEHVKMIDGVPEGWRNKSIDGICETIGGGTPPTEKMEYWDHGDIPWVTPTDITRNDCLILLDSEKKITAAGLRNSSAKIVPPDTILMTSRASVGFFALIDKEVSTNQGFINIIPSLEFMRMYILHNLIYRVEEIRLNAGGSTYMEISKSRFRSMSILIPSNETLQQFEEIAYQIVIQIRVLQKQKAKLKQARDILLPRLMNGEIPI